MLSINYFEIIQKYIPAGSKLYQIYIIHAAQVTVKAVRIAEKLKLKPSEIKFIEEAGMLHDIGVSQVANLNYPDIYTGTLPYLHHGLAGRKILETLNLPRHAKVAERHSGVGITKEEIIRKKLPLPVRDFVPKTLPEKIIAWSDIFYRKLPTELCREKSIGEAREFVGSFGAEKVKIFDQWLKLFN